MLLMVEKGITGGLCQSIHCYGKAYNKCMNDYHKNKESSFLRYWDVNNLYGWEMSQKLPGNVFNWIENISEFVERFIKGYNEKRDEGYVFESVSNI